MSHNLNKSNKWTKWPIRVVVAACCFNALFSLSRGVFAPPPPPLPPPSTLHPSPSTIPLPNHPRYNVLGRRLAHLSTSPSNSSLFSFRSLNSIGDRGALTFKPPPTRRPPCVLRCSRPFKYGFAVSAVSRRTFYPRYLLSWNSNIANPYATPIHRYSRRKIERRRNGSSLIAYDAIRREEFARSRERDQSFVVAGNGWIRR